MSNKMEIKQHDFAKKEMNRCGWSEGKGLGRAENGMKDAIKVKIKNNKGGLGHDQGAEFTFHWWDHIFNKAANSFKVSESEEGVLIEKCEGKKVTPFLISNKKPLSSKFANKSLLYGTFVKSGTYESNKKLSDSSTDSDSSDENSDDDEKLLVNDTLEKTFKLTGLTGHKAARHGFNLSGKLKRIQNQEQEQSPGSLIYSPINKNDTNKDIHSCSDVKGKKKKRKNSKHDVENNHESYSKLDEKHHTQEPDIQICNSDKPKKKKKKKKETSEKDLEVENLSQIEKSVSKLSNSINEVTTKMKKGKQKLKEEVDVVEDHRKQKKKKKIRSIKEEI